MPYHLITDDDLAARLKRCLEHRHSEITITPKIREIMATGSSDEKNQIFRQAVNDITSGLGLAALIGETPESIIRFWVEAMEKKHPQLRDL